MKPRYNPKYVYRLPIGKIKGSDKPLYIEMLGYGTILVLAKPRVGKTSVVKKLIIEMNKVGRKVIIFDYFSDYLRINKPNWNAPGVRDFARNVKVFQNFAFSLSEFKKSDFQTFGFTENGLKIVQYFASRVDVHGNDPIRFKKFLGELPDTDYALKRFNDKYDIPFDERVERKFDPRTVDSISRTFHDMTYMFYSKERDKDVLCLDNVAEMIDGPDVVVFSFKEVPMRDYQIYAAVILRKLIPVLSKYNPCFIFEEGDVLAPNISTQSQWPTSLVLIDEYVRKLQRNQIQIIVVSQNYDDLFVRMARNWQGIILGKLNEGSAFYGDVQDLLWYPTFGVREFLFKDSNEKKFVFIPDFVPCE